MVYSKNELFTTGRNEMPSSKRKVKNVCMSQEEYDRLVEAKECYCKDTGRKTDFGGAIAFLALIYLGSRFLDQQRKQQQGDSHGRQ